MYQIHKYHWLIVDATSQAYEDKLDFVRASEWLGGSEEYSHDYREFAEINKAYEDWTEDLPIDIRNSPAEAKKYLLQILSKPKKHNSFWNDHIGSLVRSINEGHRTPTAKSVYVKEIRDNLQHNLPMLTEFTKEHIKRLKRKYGWK